MPQVQSNIPRSPKQEKDLGFGFTATTNTHPNLFLFIDSFELRVFCLILSSKIVEFWFLMRGGAVVSFRRFFSSPRSASFTQRCCNSFERVGAAETKMSEPQSGRSMRTLAETLRL
jgi:hypothetical protein